MLKATVLLSSWMLLLSCNTGPKQAPAPAARDAAAAAQASPAPSPPKETHPKVVEVEAFGNVVMPPKVKVKGTIMVYIADTDCMAPDAHMLGSHPASDTGRFFIEVFPDWGKDLTICAALIEEQGKPARYYAKLPGTHKAEGMGEVELRDLVIELKQGPLHLFPAAEAK